MKAITKNKLLLTLISVMLLGSILLASCGGNAVPDRLIGNWKCDAKASDQTTDTSFYKLSIAGDGQFSLVDKDGVTPGISGTMKGDDTGKIGILELKCDEEGFTPPTCWHLKTDSRIRYKIVDENTIRLGYTGIWLTFRK